MFIYDSSKKQKLEFIPQNPPFVTLYVCGPTVYDDAHLGHARSALSFDLLYRVLSESGYRVNYVKNITDIDDKIITKAKESNKSIDEITSHYLSRYKLEMSKLGILEPTLEPRATQSIAAMIELIELLLKKGFAYKISNGDIYFDTSKDSEYLSLSKRIQDEDERQNRINSSHEKRNLADFALWKIDKNVGFDSPFGYGRPGWHIECSAMIEKHLANDNLKYRVDIHGGGADLLFPHHENEAAQTRCATNHTLAAYWIHNGFVTINNEKMSKSLGNSFFLKDALKLYDGEVLRFYLLSSHYRNSFNFNEEDLLNSKKRLDKIYRLKKRLFDMNYTQTDSIYSLNILEALQDDLNISLALSHLDEFINYANDTLDKNQKDKNLKNILLSTLEFIQKILGLGTQNPYIYFQSGVDEPTKEKILKLIDDRNEAKKVKNFQQADALREELKLLGISIMDTPQGTFWEKL